MSSSPPRFLTHPVTAPLVSAGLMLLMLLPMLGPPPLAGTEGHRVIPARQMLASGDWLVPELLGETYLRKPAGHFWLLAASQAALGDHGWAWRLPSAVSAAGLAAFLAWTGRRWYGPGGGWAAGLSALGLVALWAQSRTADIDAANTLASAVAAVAALELVLGRPERRIPKRLLWCGVLSLSLGATLLLKLHGGLSVVGGALLAGTIVGGLRAIGRPGVWLGLTGGVAVLLAWAVPVAVVTRDDPDATGIREASANVLNVGRGLDALAAQGELVLFAMPLPLILLMTPRLLKRTEDSVAVDERRRKTLAVLLTLSVGHALLLLNGVTNPRYGYVLLPMWPLLAGAVAAAWRTDRLTPSDRRFVQWVLGVTATAVPIAAAAMAWTMRDAVYAFPAEPWLTAAIVAGPIVAVAAAAAWAMRHRGVGVAALTAGLLVLALPMIVMQTQQRYDRSGREAGLVLAAHTPEGVTVIADALVRDKPEVFVYAEGVTGRSRRGLFDRPAGVDLDPGTWVGLTRAEWTRWHETEGAPPLERVVELPTRADRPAVLARVRSPAAR
mgnify:CR=1 FL=1